jgi:hypothetical protein
MLEAGKALYATHYPQLKILRKVIAFIQKQKKQ